MTTEEHKVCLVHTFIIKVRFRYLCAYHQMVTYVKSTYITMQKQGNGIPLPLLFNAYLDSIVIFF